MPLSDKEIKAAIQAGEIQIDPLRLEAIQPSSVDLTLSPTISVLQGDEVVDLGSDLKDRYQYHDLASEPYVMPPGGFVLGACNEYVHMGPYCGLVTTRSSFARMGLLCNLSSYANPGYKGTLPLAIANLSGKPIRLVPNIRMVQLLFLHVKEVENLYSSRADRKYLGERGVTPPRQHLDHDLQETLRSLGLSEPRVENALRIIERKVDEAASDNVRRFKGRVGR